MKESFPSLFIKAISLLGAEMGQPSTCTKKELHLTWQKNIRHKVISSFTPKKKKKKAIDRFSTNQNLPTEIYQMVWPHFSVQMALFVHFLTLVNGYPFVLTLMFGKSLIIPATIAFLTVERGEGRQRNHQTLIHLWLLLKGLSLHLWNFGLNKVF